jgi:hypothetical protein
MITAEQFEKAVGRKPEDDDLDRVNCSEAGSIGHLCCGWNNVENKPQFDVGPREWNGNFPRTVYPH